MMNILDPRKELDLPDRCLLVKCSTLVPYFFLTNHLYVLHVYGQAFLRFAMDVKTVPKALLPEDDGIGFVQEKPVVLQSYPNVWSLRLGGIGIHTCGHCFSVDLGNPGASDIRTGVCADTASCPSPAIPVVYPETFAAANCEADAPCSANTALYPSSSLTLSSWSTTLPVYIWRCFTSSACDRRLFHSGSTASSCFCNLHRHFDGHGFVYQAVVEL